MVKFEIETMRSTVLISEFGCSKAVSRVALAATSRYAAAASILRGRELLECSRRGPMLVVVARSNCRCLFMG